MQENIGSGLLFVLISGTLAGSFALPMKFTTGWKWQHNWLVFVTWSMFIMPLIFALSTVPHLQEIYQNAETGILLKTFLYGLSWGVGVICFGLGLEYLGVALGMSIMLGLTISIGALLPIALFQPDELLSPKSIDIMLASLIIFAGIIVCAVSGSMRDKKKRSENVSVGSKNKSKFKLGLFIAVLAGILSPMQNIGFISGNPIKELAIKSGTDPVFAGNVVWPLVMAGSFIVNILYCGYLIGKYKQGNLFKSGKKWYWLAIAVSGISWYLCMMFFGMAASRLGKLGPSIGWASFQTLAIVTGNLAGLFTGEWKNCGSRLLIINIIGILLLVCGIIVIAS